MNKNTLKNIFGNSFGFWAINKHMVRMVGFEATLVFQHLVDLDNKFNQPRFQDMIHPNYFELSNDIHLSVKAIQRAIKQLKELELLEISFLGLPARNHYRINYVNVQMLMQSSSLDKFYQARNSIFGVASSNTSSTNLNTLKI